jgi:hypothetical protein
MGSALIFWVLTGHCSFFTHKAACARDKQRNLLLSDSSLPSGKFQGCTSFIIAVLGAVPSLKQH